MKKIFGIIVLLLMLNIPCCFAGYNYFLDPDTIADEQDLVSQVGFRILNSNGIETRAVFFLDNSNTVNAYSRNTNREIVIYRGLFSLLKDEDELAAILSHEISHNVDSYTGIFRGYSFILNYILSPKKYEYKADKRAVDYMVNAGYNPVALIVIMSKAFPQYRYDWCSTHPLTTRRMMEVYEYIYKKYPEYLVKNKYRTNPYYQNFLLTSQENRVKFQEKIKSNSNKRIRYK